MKIRILLMLSLILALSLFVKAQNNRTDNYYFDITRPSCCELSHQNWKKIATNLKAQGIPAFFGVYETLNYGENWRPVKLRRTSPSEGWLILGPFNSVSGAEKILNRLPKLLPKHGDQFNAVQSGPTSDSQTWQIGMYQIKGFKTRLPTENQKPKVLKSGTIEGVIVETIGGANWFGIIVESNGVRYSIQLDGNSGGVNSRVGDVETVGNRVRITYKDIRKENDGTLFLNAIRIIQLK